MMYDANAGELPWIGPFKGSIFGQGATWGTAGSPAVGSKVAVLFQNGDPHYPVYVGGIASKALPGFVSGTNWGFIDPAGNTLNVNLATKNVSFVSAAGASFVIAPDGSVNVTAPTLNVSATNINLAGAVDIQGNVNIDGSLVNNGKSVGSSLRVGGVDPGGGTSGTPI
jgi:phage baseplate assembly protein gpV